MTRLATPLRLNGPSLMAELGSPPSLGAALHPLSSCNRIKHLSARTLDCAGFALLLAMTAGAGWGPAPDDLEGLNRQVVELYQAGKYAATTPMAERVLARAEGRFGSDHPQVGTKLNDLALLYPAQGH